MKTLVKRLIVRWMPASIATRLLFLGPKRCVLYFLAQRVLRINSHVPWPVHWSSVVNSPGKIRRSAELPYLGHHPGCYIQAINGIELGRNVRYGPGVHLISASHRLDDFDIHEPADPIIIGNNCWIGAGAIILPGVKLGDHVVVAAGAIVTRSFECNQLVGGVPARVISSLPPYSGSSDWGTYD